MRPLVRAILLVVSVLAVVSAATGQEQRPEPLPAAVVEAWLKAGACVGWLSPVNHFGLRKFRPGGEGKSGEVPGFQFSAWPARAVAKLPQPSRAFGLVLSRTAVTDAGLKDLAGLKRLHLLNLFHTQVTAAGIRELRKALPALAISR